MVAQAREFGRRAVRLWLLGAIATTTVGTVAGYRLGRRVASPAGKQSEAVLTPPGENPKPMTSVDQAQMRFAPPETDLGKHPWNSSVGFESSFVNDGAAPVTIAVLRTSCGCTTLQRSLDGVTIQPGDRLAISGVVRTGVHPGRRSEDVSLLLDTGAVHVLPLRFEVFPTYAVHPDSLDFGDVDLEENREPVASAVFHSETVHVLGQPLSDVAWLDAVAVPRGPDETALVVRALPDQLAYGGNWGHLVVNTDDSYRPTCTVNVRATGVCALRAVPSHLILQPGEQGTARFFTLSGAPAQLAWSATSAGDVSAQVAADDQGVVVVRAVEDASGATYRVQVGADTGETGHVLVSVAP